MNLVQTIDTIVNWLNENVIGEIPAKDALTDEAKETVSIAGIKG